jgi:hypothetical protein
VGQTPKAHTPKFLWASETPLSALTAITCGKSGRVRLEALEGIASARRAKWDAALTLQPN